jgi:hydroxyacyl-ACP dehydratase HTD2-like protein with hotdog domain
LSVEGHPGLVVHGPLNLINMLDYWRDIQGQTSPREIVYRATAPVYAGEEYQIYKTGEKEGGVWDVVAEKQGIVCMKGEISP